MDLPFIPAMHTPSIKPCQTKEGSSFMLQTYTQTHTCTHTGGKLIYGAVYYHYHQTKGREQEPGCISLLDAHHHCLSLRCLSGCHFSGGPARILILFPSSSPSLLPTKSVALLCCFYHFLHSLLFCFIFFFLFFLIFYSVASPSPCAPFLFLPPPSSHLVTQATKAVLLIHYLPNFLFTDPSIFWACSCTFKRGSCAT